MSDDTGRTGLAYVHGVMSRAQNRISASSKRLTNATMPDYESCPAGGQEFHEAMAESSHATNEGIGALLEWNRLQVEEKMVRDQRNKPQQQGSDVPTFKTKWFTASGSGAMWPVALTVVAILVYVLVK